jgi:hypothetical protein
MGSMTSAADIGRQLRAGAKITFPKYERYFPQISEAEAYQTVRSQAGRQL